MEELQRFFHMFIFFFFFFLLINCQLDVFQQICWLQLLSKCLLWRYFRQRTADNVFSVSGPLSACYSLFIFAIWIVLTAHTIPWLNIVVHKSRFPHWLFQISSFVKILLTSFAAVILFKLKQLGWSSHRSEF